MADEETSIRIKAKTKEELSNLDFVRKQTYNDIIQFLINFYKKKHSN